MKKILLFSFLFLSAISQAQQEETLANLLLRVEQLPSMNITFNQALELYFTEEEQDILHAHYEELHSQNNGTTNTQLQYNYLDFFYVNDTRTDRTFGTLSEDAPFVFTPIQVQTQYILTAGDYDGSGRLLALDQPNFNVGSLIEINTETGEYITLGDFSGLLLDHYTYGMSWNEVDQTMYVISGTLGAGSTQLYSIDLETAALTTIGDLVDGAGGGWLTIDEAGNAYTVDLDNDSLYSMDLSNGETTLIGPLGIDINFLQDASFDHSTNVLYMAGYLDNGDGGIYTVNTNTGATTLIGSTTEMDVEYGLFVVNPNPVLGVVDTELVTLSITPNPATDWIEVNVDVTVEIESLRILDMQGRATNLSSSNNRINLESLSNGVYLLEVVTKDGRAIDRIIKN